MKSDYSSNHPWALITGASSGIGEACAYLLAERGYRLVLVSENKRELDRVGRQIYKSNAIRSTILPMDLFKQNAADAIFSFCKKNGISIDVLVNCAGIFPNAEIEQMNIGVIQNVINLHVLNMAKLCFLFGKDMIARKTGHILNVASIAALFHDPASMTYGPTKRFILSLSDSLHLDWKEHNVTVTALMPGGIATNFFSANNVYIPRILRSHLMEPKECARAGLDAMFKGKRRIIPGIRGKIQLLIFMIAASPFFYSWTKKLYYKLKND